MTELNQVILGDNLEVMRQFPNDFADLIYMDPPFNSGRDYGEFDDRYSNTGDYLDFMRPLLEECSRILKPDGSIYVHIDSTSVHYIKVTTDSIAGFPEYRNDIIWRRTGGRSDAKFKFACVTDHILFYSGRRINTEAIGILLHDDYFQQNYANRDERGQFRAETILTKKNAGDAPGEPWRGFKPDKVWKVPRKGAYADYIESIIPGYQAVESITERLDLLEQNGFIQWTSNGVPLLKRYRFKGQTKMPTDHWDDITLVHGTSNEKNGYPTQKPLKLLERIIKASSNEGDLVVDPCCGSGTTLAAAKSLNRNYIGIDCNPEAVRIATDRLDATVAEADGRLL